MSGDATFSGTAYQAGVIALVYVHVLMEHRLGWFELFDDTPVAISGEVKGPGDDALVEFRAGTPTIEIQAKHGLSGISSFLQVMDRVRAFPGSATSVVLVVDRTSSQWLYTTVADDLDRLRSGRQEIFRAHTRNIIAELGTDALALLRRVHIKPADVDASHDPEAKLAVASLEQILVDKTQAAAAWRILRDDAAIICAKRLARTRSDLIGLLRAHSIQVRGPQPTERLNHDLDLSKAFLRRHKPQAALLVLSEIEKRLTAAKPDGKTLHRFFQHQAAAYMQLGRVEDALELARKALDHDPKGVHALMVAALAAMGLGKLEAAKQYAEEATASHPHEPLAWTTRAQVASAAELPILSPPAAVAASVEYRTGLIQVLLNETNVNEAFELTSQLLNEGVRTPDVLLFRAEALLTTDRGDVAVFVPSTADEIERLTTEAIDGEPSDDTLRRALLARAMARRALGRSTEAEEDIRRAQDVQPEDPHAISEAAQTCIVDGKFEAARRILASSVVERYPILLAFRATALANLGEKDAATKDLNEALRRVTDAHDPDAVRLAAADAALDLDDLELAERALVGLSRTALAGARYSLVRGRMAFQRDDTDHGTILFEQAAQREAKMRPACFAELGSRLVKARRPAEAVKAFEKAVPLPTKALSQYVRALLATNRLATADGLVEEQLESDSPQDWALDAAVHIALAREDIDKAAGHLQRLTARPNATPGARIELARLFIQLRRLTDAEQVIEVLASDIEALDPREQMALAQVLHSLNRSASAIDLAFIAFRRDDDDPEMHRALATLAVFSGIPLPVVEAVGPDTHVRLANTSTGATIEYTVLSGAPVKAKEHQILVATAERLGLIGLKIGDVAPVKETWGQGEWKIVELKPALQHVVQDVLAHYEDRFPDAPFFVRGFSIGKGDRPSDFAPMIGSLHAQQERRKKVLQLYAERSLALGFVGTSTGTSIAEVMDYLSSEPAGPKILVEWADREGQQHSLRAVAESKDVVLTESSLHTAQQLGILNTLAQRFSFVSPRSLHEALHRRLEDLDGMASKGHTALSAEGPGLQLREWPAGHPSIIGARDRLRDLIGWLDTNSQFEPRPLDSIESDSQTTQTRQIIGHSSFDSVALAIHHRAALYADDLGLRGLAVAANGVSFSTVSLLVGLAESGELKREEADAHLVRMMERRYFVVPMSLALIRQVLERLTGSLLIDALAHMAPPAFSPQDAGRLGAQALKWVATTPFLTNSLLGSTSALLTAMSRHWPKAVCAHALLRMSMDELVLLPHQLDVVAQSCRRFAKRATQLGQPGD